MGKDVLGLRIFLIISVLLSVDCIGAEGERHEFCYDSLHFCLEGFSPEEEKEIKLELSKITDLENGRKLFGKIKELFQRYSKRKPEAQIKMRKTSGKGETRFFPDGNPDSPIISHSTVFTISEEDEEAKKKATDKLREDIEKNSDFMREIVGKDTKLKGVQLLRNAYVKASQTSDFSTNEKFSIIKQLYQVYNTLRTYSTPQPPKPVLNPGHLSICISFDDKGNFSPCAVSVATGITITPFSTPFFIIIAHELIHLKHYLEEQVSLFEKKPPATSLKEGTSLANLAYSVARRTTNNEARVFFPEGQNRSLKEFNELIGNNLEERRTVVGPDSDDVTENTIRMDAGEPPRYIYQSADTFILEDKDIFNEVVPGGEIYVRSYQKKWRQFLKATETSSSTFVETTEDLSSNPKDTNETPSAKSSEHSGKPSDEKYEE